MTREEFETLTEQSISPEDYKIVEFVYMYHPNVSNITGKKYIAEIYKVGGIELIKDMRHNASINFDYEKKVERIQRQIRELNQEIEQLRKEAETKLAIR